MLLPVVLGTASRRGSRPDFIVPGFVAAFMAGVLQRREPADTLLVYTFASLSMTAHRARAGCILAARLPAGAWVLSRRRELLPVAGSFVRRFRQMQRIVDTVSWNGDLPWCRN